MFNRYVIVPFVVWAVAQFLKFIIAAVQGRVDFKYLYASGGMPSVHSAVVTSLAVTAFLVDGPQSASFGITAILAAIVMYDSFGVRRASGEQAAAINIILESLTQDKVRLTHPQHRLREILGHRPLEVLMGAILGFALACLFNADKLGALYDFATSRTSQLGILAVAVLSIITLIFAIIGRVLYRRKYRGIAMVERAVNRAFLTALILAVFGGLLAFLANERVAAAQWILWPGLLAVTALGSIAFFMKTYAPKLPVAIAENREQIDKQQWFEGPNRKRRAAKARAKKRK